MIKSYDLYLVSKNNKNYILNINDFSFRQLFYGFEENITKERILLIVVDIHTKIESYLMKNPKYTCNDFQFFAKALGYLGCLYDILLSNEDSIFKIEARE